MFGSTPQNLSGSSTDRYAQETRILSFAPEGKWAALYWSLRGQADLNRRMEVQLPSSVLGSEWAIEKGIASSTTNWSNGSRSREHAAYLARLATYAALVVQVRNAQYVALSVLNERSLN